MSKGLEALKELKEACETHMGRMVYILQEDRFETIEKELKELEETKKELKQVMNDYQDLGNSCYKKLKALEILKTKRVQLDTLFSIFTYHKEKENSVQLTLYNSCVGLDERKLLQNEYDLLEEVLL